MRLHRFYVAPPLELKHDFWLHDAKILQQWRKVLRYRPGQEVVLFDGVHTDRLYSIITLTDKEAHLNLKTDLKRVLPGQNIYLFWSVLKNDKNDWVLQKCTELGVNHFIPILANRAEKTTINIARAKKILVEASEQCGRSNIPTIREPMLLETAIHEFANKMPLFVCEKSDEQDDITYKRKDTIGLFVGPEGGWSDDEKQQFSEAQITQLNLHDFTLRAETACVAAVVKLLQ